MHPMQNYDANDLGAVHTKGSCRPFVRAARVTLRRPSHRRNTMQFFNPLMLLGLVAAAIPILLHLLNLRKLRHIEFSTLRFLHELQRSQVRRLKLQQWLLLVLRTAMVILAVLAFARPVVTTSLPVLGSSVRSSVVIVLDNTSSMDVRDERGDRFRWAVRRADEILSVLSSGDEVALITPSTVMQSKSVELTNAIGAVREELAVVSPTYGSPSLDALLEVAADVLANAHNAHRELYIISDFQASMLRWQDSLRLAIPADRVVIVPAATSTRLDQLDLAIDSLVVLTRIVEPSKPVEVAARVRNNSTRAVNGAVVRMRFNGEQVAQRSFDLQPGQTRMIELVAPAPPSGFVSGSVELEPDASQSNNIRYFALIVPPMPRVLVIGSKSSSVYLDAALSAVGQRQSPQVQHIEASQIGSTSLEEWDVAIVTSPLGRSGVEQLRAALIAGRCNVVVFADAASPVVEQQRFANELGFGPLKAMPRRPGQYYELRDVEQQHPLLAGVFRTDRATVGQLESPAIESALPTTTGVALIGMDGGAFLSEHVIGEGRLLYCAVPPTFDWSAMPSSGLFPVLVARAILYLSARDAVGTMVSVGERCRIPVSPRYSMADVFRMRDRTGTETLVHAIKSAGGTYVDIGHPQDVGALVIETERTGEPVASAAINPPSAEAVLELAGSQQAASYISQRLARNDVEIASGNPSLAAIVARERQRAELWPWLIGGALACAIGEMVIAARVARRTAV